MHIPLRPVDGVRITTLVDNSFDAFLSDEGLVRRWGVAGSAGPLPIVPNGMSVDGKSVDFLRAEHRFSALIEVSDGDGERRVLFDAGITPDGLIDNLDRLAIYPDTFEAIVFSHGHFDHVMGLDGLARRIGRRSLPVVLHPDFWTRRRLAGPDGAFEMPTLPPEHQAWRDGNWVPDPAVHDDQAAALHLRGKGLVVLTGCGHSGVVNILRHVRRLTGVDHVHALLGGFHLRFGPVVVQTVAALAADPPDVLVPAHCTSWMAVQTLARDLPGAFRPNAVGSRFALEAAA
jgi:7,8-dihydropterin-6-yl-methyl-4-(beta-D-ribofuranosyl)aminobenzene 5'-phosphate synthase